MREAAALGERLPLAPARHQVAGIEGCVVCTVERRVPLIRRELHSRDTPRVQARTRRGRAPQARGMRLHQPPPMAATPTVLLPVLLGPDLDARMAACCFI